MRLNILAIGAAASVLIAPGAFAQAPAYRSDMNSVLSLLQSMGHGSYTGGEWAEVDRRLDDITRRAEGAADWDAAIEAQVIKAMVLSDMRGAHQAALNLLADVKDRYGGRDAKAMKQVFVREAEVYGKMGDEGAVRRVMNEFRTSRYFDPEEYPFEVGEGRDTPLKVVRPSVARSGSTSVTAMEVARQRSQFAPGNYFPDFQLRDRAGGSVSLADYRGKVLLVDFWSRGWTPWVRDIDTLKGIRARYGSSGFDILGVALEPGSADLESFIASHRMPWRQAAEGRSLARQLGIFGEATNFLVDRNGVIIGRDLRGSDLVAAVRRAVQE